MTSTTSWTSTYSSFLTRATPLPDSDIQSLKDDKPIIKVVHSAPVGSSDLIHVFNNGKIITSSGKAYRLAEEDFEGFKALARDVAELPEVGDGMNQWRVDWPMTCRPISYVTVDAAAVGGSGKKEGQDVELSVYGFGKKVRRLTEETKGYEELPSPLWELLGLAYEADDSKKE